MNGFSLAWRSVIRKPVKSVLLFVTVFTISLLLLSGMSSGKATIQMQDNTGRQSEQGFCWKKMKQTGIEGLMNYQGSLIIRKAAQVDTIRKKLQ